MRAFLLSALLAFPPAARAAQYVVVLLPPTGSNVHTPLPGGCVPEIPNHWDEGRTSESTSRCSRGATG